MFSIRTCQRVLPVFLFFFTGSLGMAAPRDYAVQVSATVQESPPQIEFSWPADPTAEQYFLFRKARADTAWGDPVVERKAREVAEVVRSARDPGPGRSPHGLVEQPQRERTAARVVRITVQRGAVPAAQASPVAHAGLEVLKRIRVVYAEPDPRGGRGRLRARRGTAPPDVGQIVARTGPVGAKARDLLDRLVSTREGEAIEHQGAGGESPA